MSSPFDDVVGALDVIKVAEESLVALISDIDGRYEWSRNHVMNLVEEQSLELCSVFVGTDPLIPVSFPSALGVSLDMMLSKLLFLLQVNP